MKRNIYHDLLAWKVSKVRKPLILQGARQVGKTYILQAFAKAEYEQVIYLNFDKDGHLKKYFEADLDPKRIIQTLGLHFEQTIDPNKALIIFDEVQECSRALNALKYFHEEANQYHIVAAGSLLGVKLDGGFPVGKVDFMHLYPLTFFEFLVALGRDKLREYLAGLTKFEPIPFHNELLELLKVYLFTGGMPEAVKTYCDSKDFNQVRDVQENILKAYLLDIAKHAPTAQVIKIDTIWEQVPKQLGKENKKFMFSAISKSARAREYEDAIQWLVQAGLAHKVYNISAAKFPLRHYQDNSAFKLYLLDVGLLGAMSDLTATMVIKGDALFMEFKGAMAENFVIQELISHGKQPYYWASQGKAEVDVVVQQDDAIYPLEVKAQYSKRKKSLLVYGEKFRPPTLSRASQMNFAKDGNVCNYPLYLVSLFPLL